MRDPRWEIVLFAGPGVAGGGGAEIGAQRVRAPEYARCWGTLYCSVRSGILLLDRPGVAWVADYGPAKAMKGEAVAEPGEDIGTLCYTVPGSLLGGARGRRFDCRPAGWPLFGARGLFRPKGGRRMAVV
jgi:hypothetical protein